MAPSRIEQSQFSTYDPAPQYQASIEPIKVSLLCYSVSFTKVSCGKSFDFLRAKVLVCRYVAIRQRAYDCAFLVQEVASGSNRTEEHVPLEDSLCSFMHLLLEKCFCQRLSEKAILPSLVDFG